MAGKPSFFENLRRRSHRSLSSVTKPNGGDTSSIGKTNAVVNGAATPSSASTVENASTLTVDSPESTSASASEVSSSEMNPQPSNGTIRRRSSARPITAATRSSVYSMVRCHLPALACYPDANLTSHNRANRLLPPSLPLLWHLVSLTWAQEDLNGYESPICDQPKLIPSCRFSSRFSS